MAAPVAVDAGLRRSDNPDMVGMQIPGDGPEGMHVYKCDLCDATAVASRAPECCSEEMELVTG